MFFNSIFSALIWVIITTTLKSLQQDMDVLILKTDAIGLPARGGLKFSSKGEKCSFGEFVF